LNYQHLIRILQKTGAIRRLFFLSCMGLVFTACYYTQQILTLGAAYNAKILCSNTFLALREPEQIKRQDLQGLERVLTTEINFQEQSATSWLPGIEKQKAIFVERLGCVLLAGVKATQIRNHLIGAIRSTPVKKIDARSFTLSNEAKSSFNLQQLNTTIDRIFAENNHASKLQTRAILVMHKDQLIAERYATGFSKATPLLGWSMTKSVINAIVGIMVKQNKLQLEQPTEIAVWSDPLDARSTITTDHLLRMSSGLKFRESSNPLFSDLTEMLFRQRNSSAYAAAKPLQTAPDSHWRYSSGSTNIIAAIIRNRLGGSPIEVVDYIDQQLFHPLGITQATIETDTSGNLIGSSFMYATAREWLTIGQLYLQDGIWQGKRIFPEGWVEYSSTPSSTAPQGQYGAHFWTNAGKDSNPATRPFPSLPGDMYYAAGYKGQRLIILPSQHLVILHIGWHNAFSDQNMQHIITRILSTRYPE
jgi:CubicO group peptidase (beta-lactamase class C family)